MNPKINDLVIKMKTRYDSEHITVQTADFAEIMGLVAEDQTKSAAILEKQTKQLIYLTWGIVALTAVLLFFTVMLYEDARAHDEHTNLTKHSSNK